jgi:hypothetical protein
MPISKKRFSKKRVKKSVRKNTRKHKKRTLGRKHRKSGKRFRFFGGFGEDGDCAICFLPLADNTNGEVFTTNCNHHFHLACIKRWCNGKAECGCPTCRTVLNPNPNPVVAGEMEHFYRVQFFTFVNNPQTREIDRVPVSLNNIPDPEINILEDYFIGHYHGLTPDSILFYGYEAGVNPYGYIDLDLDEIYNTVVINEGDMDIHTNPPTIVQSVTITRVPNFDV